MTTARVTVTLEIDANSSWNEATSMDQIHRQALRDVEGILRHRLKDAWLQQNIRIIGEPIVTAIFYPIKKGQ